MKKQILAFFVMVGCAGPLLGSGMPIRIIRPSPFKESMIGSTLLGMTEVGAGVALIWALYEMVRIVKAEAEQKRRREQYDFR
jgi:hypothetical protein